MRRKPNSTTAFLWVCPIQKVTAVPSAEPHRNTEATATERCILVQKKHLVQCKKGSQLHSAIKSSKLTQNFFLFFFFILAYISVPFLGCSLQCTCRCKCWVTCQSDQEGWSHLCAVYSKWPNIQACRTSMLQDPDCTKIKRSQATSSHCRTAVLKMNIC